jgi:hypothetical protein
MLLANVTTLVTLVRELPLCVTDVEVDSLCEVFMLIVIVTALCLAQHLLPEQAAWLAGIETDAFILAISVFAFIFFRVRLGTRRAGM